MIKFIETQKVPLTRDVAEDFATMPSWKGERPLEERRIHWLHSKVEQGLFHSPTWCKAYMDGHPVRIDGQHSSNMLVRLDGEFPDGLSAVILSYQVETELELAELFNQFNQRESVRTTPQTIGAHAAVEPSIADIKPTWIGRAIAGIGMSLSDGQSARMSDTERGRLIHHNTDFIRWVHAFVKDRALNSGAVVGVMYDSYHKNLDDATQFWWMVKNESHPDPQHPTRVLARVLRERVTDMYSRRPMKWTHRDIFIKCRHAWNAYRRGHSTTLKVHRDAGTPKLL